MAVSFNTTTGTAILKRLYATKLAELVYPKCKFAAIIPKDEKFYGEGTFFTQRYATEAGGSSDFNQAQANKAPSEFGRFFIDTKDEFVLASISHKLIAKAGNNAGAIVNALETQVEGAMRTYARQLAFGMYSNGGGSRGVVSSSVSATTITLANRSQSARFEKNMWVQLAADDGTGGAGVRAGGAKAQITAVNRNTGTITFSANLDTLIAGATNGDYIFRAGDYNNVFAGLGGWCPASDPTGGDSWFGVDRSTDSRLGGQRFSGLGGNPEEVLIDAFSQFADNGGEFDTLLINHLDYAKLLKNKASKSYVEVATTVPKISFKALEFETGAGMVAILPETDCPQGTAFATNKGDWKLVSAGKNPGFLTFNGDKLITEAASNSFEMRIGAYLNTVCMNTNNVGRITW